MPPRRVVTPEDLEAAQITAKPWRPQPGPQEKAIRASFVTELFFGGARGGGKGLPLDSGVLTPWGFRKLKDLGVGSRICSTDGQAQEIIGYFRRGVQPVYDLTWSDGTVTRCDADHIWLGWWSNRSGKRGGDRLSGVASSRKWSTRQLLDRTRKSGTRFGIPVMDSPCVFNVHGENAGRYKHISRTIPPYVLGVLLGDGCITDKVRVSTADEEVIERLRAEIDPEIDIAVYRYAGSASECRIGGYFNDLVDLGIAGCKAHEKQIPRIYLHATAAERWALLQGLMDTDGWADEDGDIYFCSVSKQLAVDVQYLCRSLGAVVTWREKVPTYPLNGETMSGRRAYTLRVKLREPWRAFHLTRKRERCASKTQQSMALWLDNITYAGEEETACIVVSHHNNLFVTDGFVVTHNSDYLLGDYAVDINTYGAHWRGVLIRRTYPELDELIERSHAVFPAAFPGCQYRVGSKTWRFPSGAMLRLRHLKHEADADHYQGHAYCVAEGTLVWMADGSMVPIERVRVGDMVQTLEGPRTVTGTMVPQIKECVEVFHGTTSLQCHPIDHPLLGTSSWQSAASLLHTSATGTSQTSQGFDRPPCVSMSARCAVRTREHGEPCGTPPDSATFPPSREGLPQWSLETLQGALPQIAESLTRRPSQRAGHHETPGYTSLQSLWRAGGCAPIGPEGERGFQGDCLPDRHSGGEQPQLPTASAQGASPSQVCAVAPSLSRYTQDDSGSTQGHSRTCEPAYAHPYTGEPRFPLLRTRDVALTLSPCGPRLVYDLTVQEVNHYITGSQGLVNRNSWIGFDELTSWPSLRAYHKLKACLRVGSISIPVKRIRATGNPGGPGHIAVKSYFIDPAPESTIITDPETGDTRMFIRSRLTDNHILMHNDPNYASRLRGVGDAALVKAWLTGDWDVFVGQYFSSWDTNDVVIDSFDVPESWPLFGAMDYGEASPTSFGLYTVDHDFTVYRIQGYYMANKSGSQHADAINKMIDACPFTAGRRPSVIYVDPSMFTRRRLSSEQVVTSPADVFAAGNLFLTPANNDRITGWRNINDALVKGRFKAFRGWNDALVNTLPALPRDPANPEDVDSDAEDHAGDELRYAMMHVYKPALAVAAPDRNPILGANVLKSMEVHRKPEHRRRRSLVL